MKSLNHQLSDILTDRRDALAEAIVSRELGRRPEIEKRYGAAVREKACADARFHLSFLAAAIRTETPALFVDYVAWMKVLLVKRGIHVDDIVFHLECLSDVVC